MTSRDVVIISTADWDNPYWTNKQHVALELARLGYRVLYVESLGLRQPTLSSQDLGRLWRRLKRGLAMPRKVRENLWVCSPLAIPLHRYRIVRGLNRLLLGLLVRVWLTILGLKRDLLWTYSPLTPSLLDVSGYRTLVYHAVDDIAAQPGMPKAAIEANEKILVARADVVFVTAPALLQTHLALNARTYYLPNVADFDHFAKAALAETVVPADITALPAPRIGFIGAISGYKIDFELIRAVVDARPQWSMIFVGGVGEGDPWTKTDILQGCPNIHFLGGRPYAVLPSILKGFDVAILPNRLNDYTRAMFPMKFFEYLAAGKPVVSTNLPALAEFRSVATFCNNADSFIAGIEMALRGEAPPMELRLEAARRHTYAQRMLKMLNLLEESGH